MANTESILIIFFAAKDGEAPYCQKKTRLGTDCAYIMNSFLQNSNLS